MNDKLKYDLKEMKYLLGLNLGCGWMVDDVAQFLYSLIKFTKPDLVIQTGHLWGKSARFVLEALEENAQVTSIEQEPKSGDGEFYDFTLAHTPAPKKGSLISVDPNMFNLNPEVFEYLKTRYSNFSMFIKKSKDFFKDFEPVGDRMVLFGIVDGDHTYEGCRNDLVEFARIGAQYILVDDTIWIPALKDCCNDFVIDNRDYKVVHYSIYNGISLLTKV